MSIPALSPRDTEPSVAELIAARPFLSMNALDGLLLEGVPLGAVADALGTPAWVYSAGTMRPRRADLPPPLNGHTSQFHLPLRPTAILPFWRVFPPGAPGANLASKS